MTSIDLLDNDDIDDLPIAVIHFRDCPQLPLNINASLNRNKQKNEVKSLDPAKSDERDGQD